MTKRFTFLLFAFCLANGTLTAQNFTLRLSGGYAWPGFVKTEQITGPKVDPFTPHIDGLLPMSNINDSIPSFQNVYGSYGQGMNFTFGFGYMINPYIGVEMGMSYLKSDKISCTQTRQLTFQTGFGIPPQYTILPDYYFTAKIQTQAFGLSLMPSIVVQGAKPGWKVYPYGRLGISLPVFGGLTHKIAIDMGDNVDTYTSDTLVYASPYFLGRHVDVTLKTHGTVSVGFNGALGVAYRPLPYLAITAEVNGQYLVTRAKESEITQWDTDGKSRLDDRGVYRTKFVYVDKLDDKSNNAQYNSSYDPTKPKEDLRPIGPFNNLGVNIGVIFYLSKETLGKKEKKKTE